MAVKKVLRILRLSPRRIARVVKIDVKTIAQIVSVQNVNFIALLQASAKAFDSIDHVGSFP